MKMSRLAGAVMAALALAACSPEPEAPKQQQPQQQQAEPKAAEQIEQKDDFQWEADRFADIRVLRYQVPGFEELEPAKKELLYYLYEAALAGRDIMWDQNYRHNLRIRHTLEAIVRHFDGKPQGESWDAFMTYVKRVWFSNGIHHHYANTKILPGFDQDYFASLVRAVPAEQLPLDGVEGVDGLLALLGPVMFDPKVDAKKVVQQPGVDKVQASAINFYGEDVTEQEVVDFYAAKVDADPKRPASWGLNSKLVKEDGKLVEKVWKVGGMYGAAIERIVFWLEKAAAVAETPKQQKALELLIKYYKSGDLKDFDAYSIAWVEDVESDIDVVNGFIEVYNDPMALRGSFESIVNVKDPEGTKRIKTIADNAQWFEDNSPIMDEHKKAKVAGITGKAINVVVESGDASPSTPIGINLPNANWIRAEHGSKSVNLSNIVAAYDNAKGGTLEEFAYSEAEIKRAKEFAAYADHLHTDMHEVIGHASGKINEGVGTPAETLKQYASTLEEGRADLVALVYLHDQKLVDLGLMPSLEVGKAAYDDYIRNGLMVQLTRIEPGHDIEEAHMRNRALVARWAMEKGAADKVIEKKVKDGKSYFVVNDYDKLHGLFKQLLRELQRIKSEGDFEAGKALVENYGVKVDPELHAEVLKRYQALDLAPYAGFVNPELTPVMDGDQLVDVTISYPTSFQAQMLGYGDKYSALPVVN
ncbi:hypothetical protein [Gallaecimonas sp. GXIMD4217]|uniref:dipeptidyl-peptidase 3 family protein n=1 Tax=Gallaecimonas sp. GXIMD4217 TaxID=3131927 RepID=UPI00311AE851